MKNIKLKYILLLCLILACNISCSTLMQIERQENFSLLPSNTNQIVSINPSFKPWNGNEQKYNDNTISNKYSETIKKEREFNQILINNAKKNGIVLQVIDSDELQLTDSEYFEYLAPLSKEIIQANKLQPFKAINTDPQKQKNTEFFYKNAPKIGTHFSHLAELYGTPFFAIQGVSFLNNKGTTIAEGFPSTFSTGVETLYYTIIADVSKSEIVYREFRQVNSEVTQSNLNSIVYDSFRIIAN
jgi:hypothetical protein